MRFFLTVIFIFSVSAVGLGASAQSGDFVKLPDGSNLKPVRQPKGNGLGPCGFSLIWNSVEAHSKVRASFGVEAFNLDKSKNAAGEPTMAGIEFGPIYEREAVLKAIEDLNKAFGEGSARLLEANDLKDGKLQPNFTGIVVSQKFVASGDKSVCSDKIKSAGALFNPAPITNPKSNCQYLEKPFIFATTKGPQKYCMAEVRCDAIEGYAVCKPVGASSDSCPSAADCAEDPNDAKSIRPTLDIKSKTAPKTVEETKGTN